MNMFARFNENPAMTLQDIKETNVTDVHTLVRTDNVKTVYPPQTKFAGGYKNNVCGGYKDYDQSYSTKRASGFGVTYRRTDSYT